MPSILRGLIGVQLQFQRGGEGERALRSHQQPRQIVASGGARGRGQRVDVVAADAAKLAREAGGDFLGLGGAQRAQPLHEIGDARRACRRRGCRAARRTDAACRRPAGHRWPARCRPSARSGSTSSRRNCCRPCRRWCSAHACWDRPGRTARAASAPRSDAPAPGPGSTSAVPAAASTASTRRRYLLQSITSARLTVCPHWLVPPPRASTGTPASRQIASAAATSSMPRGTITPSGITW